MFTTVLVVIVLSSLTNYTVPRLECSVASSLASDSASSLIRVPGVFSLSGGVTGCLSVDLFSRRGCSGVCLNGDFGCSISCGRGRVAMPAALRILARDNCDVMRNDRCSRGSCVCTGRAVALGFASRASDFATIFCGSSGSSIELGGYGVTGVHFRGNHSTAGFDVGNLSGGSAMASIVSALNAPSRFCTVASSGCCFSCFVLHSSEQGGVHICLSLVGSYVATIRFSCCGWSFYYRWFSDGFLEDG